MRAQLTDESDRYWRRRRWRLFWAHMLLLATVFYFAWHRFLFGQWIAKTPADLVPMVQQQMVPLVVLIKKYQLEHGHLPHDESDLFPSHRNGGYNNPFRGSYWQGKVHYTHLYGWIVYDFTPGSEGFTITGSIMNGPIPVPPIVLPSNTSTRPSPHG